MENTIKLINLHLKEFLAEYPEIPAPKMNFTGNFNGDIYFNNHILCRCNDLILKEVEILLDQITFYFNENRFIKIDFRWEEDSPPTISSFVFGYSL